MENPETVDWAALIPRLSLFASKIHSKVLQDVHGAPTPEDLVQDTITDVLTGRRTLPNLNEVSLLHALCSIVRSKASNYVNTIKSGNVSWEEGEHDKATFPRQDTILREEELFRTVFGKIEDDPELVLIAKKLWDEPRLTPRELSALTDIEIKDVYNALRRLRYRLKEMKADLAP